MGIETQIERWRSQADSFEELASSSQYKRVAPNLFGLRTDDAALRHWVIQEIARPHVEVPEIDLYRHKNAHVANVGLAYDERSKVIEVSARDHVVIPAFDTLVSYCNSGIDTIDEPCVMPFKAGKDNYGHVLVEMMSKLEVLFQQGRFGYLVLLPQAPVAIQAMMDFILSEVFENKFRFMYLRDALTKVNDLFIVGPTTEHNRRKSRFVSDLAERIKRKVPTALHSPTKIYVSRRGSSKRGIPNELALELRLRMKGYAVVRPELLSFPQQVQLFLSAEKVISPLGAALTSTVFSPNHAHITMIDPGLYDFFFFDLSSLKGQTFNWLFSRPLVRFDAQDLHARVPPLGRTVFDVLEELA